MDGRIQEPLDDSRMFFLTTYTEDGGRVRSYSVDVEKASDSHYEFTPDGMDALDEHLATRYAGATLVERLTQFIADCPSTMAAEDRLLGVAGRLGVKVQQYHFDDYG